MLQLNLSPFPVLKTERLILRQINEDDIPLLYALRMNELTMAYVDRDKPAGMDEVVLLVSQMNTNLQENKGISWCLTFPGKDELIGIAGFWRTEPQNYRAELGYMLHPDHWGRGLMTEALTIIIRYAFDTLGFHSIEADVNPFNKQSRKLLEKLGFIQEAYFKENYYYNGNFLDSVIYSLLTPGTKKQKEDVDKPHSDVLSNKNNNGS